MVRHTVHETEFMKKSALSKISKKIKLLYMRAKAIPMKGCTMLVTLQ